MDRGIKASIKISQSDYVNKLILVNKKSNKSMMWFWYLFLIAWLSVYLNLWNLPGHETRFIKFGVILLFFIASHLITLFQARKVNLGCSECEYVPVWADKVQKMMTSNKCNKCGSTVFSQDQVQQPEANIKLLSTDQKKAAYAFIISRVDLIFVSMLMALIVMGVIAGVLINWILELILIVMLILVFLVPYLYLRMVPSKYGLDCPSCHFVHKNYYSFKLSQYSNHCFKCNQVLSYDNPKPSGNDGTG